MLAAGLDVEVAGVDAPSALITVQISLIVTTGALWSTWRSSRRCGSDARCVGPTPQDQFSNS